MRWTFWRRQRTHQRPNRAQRWQRPFLEELELRLVLSTSGLDLVTFSGTGYDFNHDGNADVLTYDRQTGNVFVDLMNGQGQAYGPQQGLGTFFVYQNTNPQLQMAGAGNWLGAKNTDILWENTSTDQPVIWKMQGLQFTGTTVTLPYTIDTNSHIVGEADFDHNGTADLLLENDATHSLTVWLMSGTQRVGVVSIAQALPDSSTVVGVGDINGDGAPDILIESPKQALTAWLMDPITNSTDQVHQPVDMGQISNSTFNYSVGGITQLHNKGSGIVSDILLRAENGVDQANFVDLEVAQSSFIAPYPPNKTLQIRPNPVTIYTRAPIHQAFITADQIASLPLTPQEQSHDLVPIVPGNPQVQFKEINGEQYVLLGTWTDFPKPDTRGVTWTAIPSQLQAWYEANPISTSTGPGGSNFYQRAYQRTTQLEGLPNDKGHSYFAEFWVPVSATTLWRPAPDPTYTTTVSPLTEPATFQDQNYPLWYHQQQTVSYAQPIDGVWPGGYPWTRLGYTYDWGNPGPAKPGLVSHEGVTEYIIPPKTAAILNDVASNEVYWGRIYGTDLKGSAGQPITYTDAAGQTVTVTLSGPGQVEVVLPPGGGNAVAFNTTGTNMTSSLAVTVSGGGITSVNEINVGTGGDPSLQGDRTDSLGSLLAPNVDKATADPTQGITGAITGAIGTVVMHNYNYPPSPPTPPTPPAPPAPPTPGKPVSNQLLLSAMLEQQIVSPEDRNAVQQQLVQLFTTGGSSSSPDAVALVWQEARLVLDLVAAANLAAQGTPSTGLMTDIQNLSAAIAVNPFYNTTVGYQVAVLTGALSLDALTEH